MRRIQIAFYTYVMTAHKFKYGTTIISRDKYILLRPRKHHCSLVAGYRGVYMFCTAHAPTFITLVTNLSYEYPPTTEFFLCTCTCTRIGEYVQRSMDGDYPRVARKNSGFEGYELSGIGVCTITLRACTITQEVVFHQ